MHGAAMKILLFLLIRSLTLRDEHRLRVFENGVLRKIFGPKRREVIGDRGNYVKRNTVTLTPCQILWRGMGWAGRVVLIVEMHTFFVWLTRRKKRQL